MDFDPSGERIATIDKHGKILVSDVNTNTAIFGISSITFDRGTTIILIVAINFVGIDYYNRVRWNRIPGSPLIATKYKECNINLIDAEKETHLFTDTAIMDCRSNLI